MTDKSPRFQPLPSGRNFELVIKELRTAVARGRLQPGQKLPAEPELAGQFGVSRSALREALKVMELSGDLEVRRGYGGGTFIAHPRAEEFPVVAAPMPLPTTLAAHQLMEVRLAIEPFAARLATQADLQAVLGLHEAIRRMRTFDDRPARVLAAAFEFHIAVAQAAGNPVFVAVLLALQPRMYQAMNRLVQDSTWRERCRADHERIAKEIEAGDPLRAERAMRRHLLNKGGVEADDD